MPSWPVALYTAVGGGSNPALCRRCAASPPIHPHVACCRRIPCVLLPLFCRCSAAVLPRSAAPRLPQFCRNSAAILPVFCRLLFGRVLPRFCRCSAAVLPAEFFWRGRRRRRRRGRRSSGRRRRRGPTACRSTGRRDDEVRGQGRSGRGTRSRIAVATSLGCVPRPASRWRSVAADEAAEERTTQRSTGLARPSLAETGPRTNRSRARSASGCGLVKTARPPAPGCASLPIGFCPLAAPADWLGTLPGFPAGLRCVQRRLLRRSTLASGRNLDWRSTPRRGPAELLVASRVTATAQYVAAASRCIGMW